MITAHDFIRALFEGGEGFFEFRFIDQESKTENRFYTVEEALKEPVWKKLKFLYDHENRKDKNIYYGIHPRTQRRGTKEDVKSYRILWADLDLKMVDDALIKKNSAPFKQFNLQPSIVVGSGHGYHWYWLLKEEATPQEATPVLEQLLRVLGADDVIDPPRVLRIPNTWNVKDPKNPVLCKVLKFDTEKTFNLIDFDPLSDMPDGARLIPRTAAPKESPKEPATVTRELYGNGHAFPHMMARTIAPYWKEGDRHKMAMAVSGLLRREEVDENTAVLIMEKISEITNDNEAQDRIKAVRTTYRAQEGKFASSGLIKEILGEDRNKFFFAFNLLLRAIPPPAPTRTKMPEFNLYECAPPGSLFDQYVLFQSKFTDAPPQHHLVSLLTVCAGVLGNKVWYPYFGSPTLFSTLYTMIVASPGDFRKSATIGTALEFARSIPGFTEFSDSATEEGLYEEFVPEEEANVAKTKTILLKNGDEKEVPCEWKASPEGIIKFSELGRLYGSSQKSYMLGIQSFFTDLYDGGKTKRNTKSGGRKVIQSSAISILGAIQPETLKNYLQAGSLEGGLLSRNLMVPEPENHTPNFDLFQSRPDGPEIRAEKEELANKLLRLSKCSGPYRAQEDAAKTWGIFAHEIDRHKKKLKADGNAVVPNILCRLDIICLKIAMIYACERGIGSLAITNDEMTAAVTLGRFIAKSVEHSFQGYHTVRGDRDMEDRVRILKAIERWDKANPGKPITHSQVLVRTRIPSKRVQETVKTLQEEGQIEIGAGRRSVKYTLRR